MFIRSNRFMQVWSNMRVSQLGLFSFFGVRYHLPFLIVGLTAHRLSQTETCGQFSLEIWFGLLYGQTI